MVLRKNPVWSVVSESRRNNMNIYSLKNIIERYWDRIQKSQSRRWLINGCKWSSFLAMQYSNSTDLKPLIRDFIFKGLSFSQTILCYSKKNATPCKICFRWILSSLPLWHCWGCIHIWRGKKHICRMQSSRPYLVASVHFASSLHLSFRIACLPANTQAKLGTKTSRYRALTQNASFCTAAPKAII